MLVFLVLALLVQGFSSLSLIKFSSQHAHQTGARCLDGSPAGFYGRTSSRKEDADKVIFYMEGGGYCSDEQDCKHRSTTNLGSSKNWPATTSGDTILSNNPSLNPKFFGWNHIFIPYCGGDVHVGISTNATEKTWGLYFAGHVIVDTIMKYLMDHHNLGSATEVILGGGSAGGIGSFVHTDWLADMLPNARVVGFPNAGWFLFVDTYENKTENLAHHLAYLSHHYDFWMGNEACYKATKNLACASSAPVIYPYTKTARFIAESEYDTNQLYSQDGTPGSPGKFPAGTEAKQYVENFGTTMRTSLQAVVNNPRDGIFGLSCYEHVLGYTHQKINHTTLYDAFTAWYYGNGAQVKLVDRCGDLACNPTCGDNKMDES